MQTQLIIAYPSTSRRVYRREWQLPSSPLSSYPYSPEADFAVRRRLRRQYSIASFELEEDVQGDCNKDEQESEN
jgi:hypothetical protein